MAVAEQLSLSGGVLAVVVVLSLVELVLVIVSIVDLIRRQAVLGGRKWVWVIVIVLFNIVGPIVYLAVGRVPPPAAETQPPAPPGDRVSAAADLLYGARRDDDATP